MERMRKGSVVRRPVDRISLSSGAPERARRRDALATEEPMEIRLTRGHGPPDRVAVTMRTPGSDFELAAGFLFGEGVVRRSGDVSAIRYCAGDRPQQYNVVEVQLGADVSFDPAVLGRNFYTTSSCGVCGKASIDAVMSPVGALQPDSASVRADILATLPERLRAEQKLFDRTGGLHAAALFDAEGGLIRLREDVGRHNAMDKLIGAALLADEVPLGERVALMSGRLSFELVQKAARAGIPVLAGVSAPSSLAAELAEQVGMTLIGFLRGSTFNIYSHGTRIT
jgi:FdhD protein